MCHTVATTSRGSGRYKDTTLRSVIHTLMSYMVSWIFQCTKNYIDFLIIGKNCQKYFSFSKILSSEVSLAVPCNEISNLLSHFKVNEILLSRTFCTYNKEKILYISVVVKVSHFDTSCGTASVENNNTDKDCQY